MTQRRTEQKIGCLLALCCAMALLACASSSAPARQKQLREALAGAPEWVRRDCHEGRRRVGKHVVCGVGSMGRSRNPERAFATAIARARSEIARALEIRVTAMLKDYQSSTAASAEPGRAEKASQRMTDVSHQITRISVSGSEVTGTWVSESGAVFALVTLEVERFRAAIREMNLLSEQLRLAIDARASQAFDADDSHSSCHGLSAARYCDTFADPHPERGEPDEGSSARDTRQPDQDRGN